jgi:hypothetical protein
MMWLNAIRRVTIPPPDIEGIETACWGRGLERSPWRAGHNPQPDIEGMGGIRLGLVGRLTPVHGRSILVSVARLAGAVWGGLQVLRGSACVKRAFGPTVGELCAPGCGEGRVASRQLSPVAKNSVQNFNTLT